MRESLQKFIYGHKDGLYYIGHSSALIKIKDDLILFDGIWEMLGEAPPYENFIFYPKQADCAEILPLITAAIVSHEHLDHWSAAILEALPCGVHVMDGRPRLVERLAAHAPVFEVPRLKWTNLTENVEVFFVPNPRNTVDSSCLIRGNGFTAYLGSDNFLDRGLCQTVAMAGGTVNVACIPWQFVHYYPALMEMEPSKKKEEAFRLKRQSIDQAKMFIDIVRPREVIPFGGNLLYCEGPDHLLNVFLAKPEDLVAGSQIKTEETPEWRPLPPMDFKVELTDEELLSIIDRVHVAGARAPDHVIVVNDVVTIDCDSKHVYDGVMEALLRDKKVHRFYFDSPVFHSWARGSQTFEQALGSRRFKYSRAPDLFEIEIVEFWANYL